MHAIKSAPLNCMMKGTSTHPLSRQIRQGVTGRVGFAARRLSAMHANPSSLQLEPHWHARGPDHDSGRHLSASVWPLMLPVRDADDVRVLMERPTVALPASRFTSSFALQQGKKDYKTSRNVHQYKIRKPHCYADAEHPVSAACVVLRAHGPCFHVLSHCASSMLQKYSGTTQQDGLLCCETQYTGMQACSMQDQAWPCDP